MTTTVTVNAHCCADTKEVRIKITDPQLTDQDFILQDGETSDYVVYDGRKIIVREVEK